MGKYERLIEWHSEQCPFTGYDTKEIEAGFKEVEDNFGALMRFHSLATSYKDYLDWQQAPVMVYLRTLQMNAHKTAAQQKYYDIISKNNKWTK